MTKFAVKIAIDGEDRLQRMRENIRRDLPRLTPQPVCPESVAICGYGPTLRQTWQQIQTPWVVATSGAHDFLIERGITPVWYVEYDPRDEKLAFVKNPCSDTTYCLASVCHDAMFEHLRNNKILLWHALGSQLEPDCKLVEEVEADGILLLGGSTSGLRAVNVAHVLGFRNFDLFGLDCSYEAGEIWAGPHVGQRHNIIEVECNGRKFQTSDVMINAADELLATMMKLPGCRFQVHGDSLFAERVKLLSKNKTVALGEWWRPVGFKPKIIIDGADQIAARISKEYQRLNCKLHQENEEYGSFGFRHADVVRQLMRLCNSNDVLDYGCGKRNLEKALGMQINNYDPAISDCRAEPRPADIVVCTDVLEHVEMQSIDAVVSHVAEKTKRIAFFEIATRPSTKTLADGRNTHLIIRAAPWWVSVLQRHFDLLGPAFGDQESVKAFCLPKAR